MEERTPYALASLAGCASPDSPDSPGARFLKRVETDVFETIEYDGGIEPHADVHETAFQIADRCVPVYTHERWETFVDLAAYTEDTRELGDDGSDLTQSAGLALYMIAERLAAELLEEAQGQA